MTWVGPVVSQGSANVEDGGHASVSEWLTMRTAPMVTVAFEDGRGGPGAKGCGKPPGTGQAERWILTESLRKGNKSLTNLDLNSDPFQT